MVKKLYFCATLVLSIMVFPSSHIFAQSLERIGSYDSLIAATDVVVSGQYAYVVDGVRGLVILDISNSASPTFVGSYNGPWNEMSLALQGGNIYLGSGSTEPYVGLFSVVDIFSDPSNPFLMDSISFNWEVTMVASRSYHYGACIATYGGNYVISADDPHNIQVVDTFDTPGYVLDMFNETNLFVADGQAGLSILDTNFMLIGSYNTPGIAQAVSMSGFNGGYYAGIADNDSGFEIINVVNRSNPVFVSRINLSGHVKDVIVSNWYAYLANESNLVVAKIFHPESPEIIASATVAPTISGLDVQDDYVYMACQGSLQIYHFIRGGCQYIPGDINGNHSVNGVDIVYAIGYFKSGGGNRPPVDCGGICPESSPFYAAGDVNGSCTFNAIDITYFARFLKRQVPSLLVCPDCQPN